MANRTGSFLFEFQRIRRWRVCWLFYSVFISFWWDKVCSDNVTSRFYKARIWSDLRYLPGIFHFSIQWRKKFSSLFPVLSNLKGLWSYRIPFLTHMHLAVDIFFASHVLAPQHLWWSPKDLRWQVRMPNVQFVERFVLFIVSTVEVFEDNTVCWCPIGQL